MPPSGRQPTRTTPRAAAGAVAVAALALLAACAPDGPAGDEPAEVVAERGPHDPDAREQPEQILVEPSEAQPGETLEVHFPDEMQRGVHLVLEHKLDDGTWQYLYSANTNAHEEAHDPHVVTAHEAEGGGEKAFGIPDVGVFGPGPDPLPLPEAAPAGEYRVCTGNSRRNVCSGPFTVLPAE